MSLVSNASLKMAFKDKIFLIDTISLKSADLYLAYRNFNLSLDLHDDFFRPHSRSLRSIPVALTGQLCPHSMQHQFLI